METALTVFLRGGLRIQQPAKGYRFNVDSVLLAQFATVRDGEAVVDLGAGSGILLLLAGYFGHPSTLLGIELQSEMAELCRENLWENGWEERGGALAADLRDLSALPQGAFALAVANPPYHGAGRSQACQTTAKDTSRRDASLSPAQLFQAADHLLAPEGRFCLLIPEPRREEMMAAMKEQRFSPWITRSVRPSAEKAPNVHLVQARREAVSKPVVLPDLVLWEAPKRYHPPVQRYLHGERGAGPRFFADCMVGRLAKALRLSGYDCAFASGAEDGWLLEESRRTGRILLTRDQELLERALRHGVSAFAPPGDEVRTQLREVVRSFGSPPEGAVPQCVECNVPFLPLSREAAKGKVPPYTWLTRDRFQGCPCCGKLTWEGSHLARFRAGGGEPEARDNDDTT